MEHSQGHSTKSGQSNTSKMNGIEPQMRIRWEDIEVVKELIERCMWLYLNKDQVVEALRVVARIEPKLTSMVWDKLERDNQQFFEDYYKLSIVRLPVPVHSVQINNNNKSEYNEGDLESIDKKTRSNYNPSIMMSMNTQELSNARARNSEGARRLLGLRPRYSNATSQFLYSPGYDSQQAGNSPGVS